MSACFCILKADGTRTCRASRVTEAGDLFCLHERTVEAAVREAIEIVDARPDGAAIAGVPVDAATLVRLLRAAGWRIEPPRKVSP